MRTLARITMLAVFLLYGPCAPAQSGPAPFFPDLDTTFRSSAAVVAGHVKSVAVEQSSAATTNQVATIDVVRRYKGTTDDEIKVQFSRPADERACFRSPCVTFDSGTDYLLFLSPVQQDNRSFELSDDRVGKIRVPPPPASTSETLSGERGLLHDSIEGLRNPDPILQQQSIRVAAGLGDQAAIPLLREHLETPIPAVKGAILVALIRLGDASAWPFALQFATAPTADPMAHYYQDLVRAEVSTGAGISAVPEIIHLTASPDAAWRQAAVRALRRIRDPRSVPTLVQLLGDKNVEIAYEALMSLAELEGKSGDWAPSLPTFMTHPAEFIHKWRVWWETAGRNQYSPAPRQ